MAFVSRRFQEVTERAGAHPLVVLGVLVALLYWARVFFITFALAVAIAFILEPFVVLLMRARFPRALASFVVCSLALLVVYLLGLGAYTQAAGLIEDYRASYGPRVAEAIQTVRTRIEDTERTIYQVIVPAKQQQQQQQSVDAKQRKKKIAEPVVPPSPPLVQEVRIQSTPTPIVDYISERIGSLYQIVLMASFVPFLVYFMLSWRDHVYRSFLQFFEGEDRAVAAKSMQGIADMVRAFVVGNFALGLLLAAVSSLAFWKMGVPYPLLVGPISGFLSLVPYIGLPLALLPPFFVSVMVFTGISGHLLILAVVTMLHVIALNLLYPKLVGSR
ncbi:MAG: AI-2E family transporter, partial [Bryobacteraceae bacterium]